jgi:dipeptidyl aminopeptidase/acylaminoacyl peptidase
MPKPGQREIPISRYLYVRRAAFPSFSPDGQRLSFIADITGVPQVWQVGVGKDLDSPAWPEQLTFEAERVSSAQFSPAAGDGRLLYARDAGGNENMQLFVLSADGSREINLTAGYEEAMHIPGRWSDDGRQVLFAANRRERGLFDLYVQPVDGKARLVWQNDHPGFLFDMSFSPDGQRAIVTRVSSSFCHDLLEIDLAASAARSLFSQDEQARYVAGQYAPDGRSLLVNTDAGSEFLYAARLDLETCALEPLVAPRWDVECLTLSPDGQSLAYAVNVDGAHQLEVLDLRTGKARKMPGQDGTPGQVNDGRMCFAPDGRRLAFSFTSATRTADVFVWDLEDDDVRAVTSSSHGGIPPASFVAPAPVHYPAFDRGESGEPRQIPAWFYRPSGAGHGQVPGIVWVHGGPEGQYRPAFDPLIQFFVRSGYAVLAPNVRGSTGYGKAYSHLDDVEKRMDAVADLAHAAYWLCQQPGIDGDRLVVYGGSYGGFMVLSALTTYPDLWAAGIDIVGISNLATFLENTSGYRRAHREAEYGSLERDRAFLERIAPINHLDRIRAPLMVIHGANDPRVPLSEAEQLVTALQARGVPVEFLVFDDEGHGLVKLKNKLVAFPAIVDFLNKHLAE